MKDINWTSPATKFLKKNKKMFSQNIKFKIIQPKTKDEFVTTSLWPALQGTMLDIVFSWILNKKILVDKYKLISIFVGSNFQKRNKELEKYKFYIEEQNLKEKYITKNLFNLAYLSAILTMGFRSGMIKEQVIKFIEKEKNFDTIFTKKDIKNLKIILLRIIKKVNTINTKDNYIDNPIFGCYLPNGFLMKADGDYFYNNTLVDMKSSKYPNIKKDYIYQLCMYYFLNEFNTNPINIKYFEIYNPLWNITYKINIKKIDMNFKFIKQEL